MNIRGENILQLLLTKIATSLFTLQEKFSKWYFRKVNRAPALCSEAIHPDFDNGQKVSYANDQATVGCQQ